MDLAPYSTPFPGRGQHSTTNGNSGLVFPQTHLSTGDVEGGDRACTVAAISPPRNRPLLPTLSLSVHAWTQDQKTHSEGPKLAYYSSQPMHLQLVHKTAQKKNWQLYPSKYGNPRNNCTKVEGSGPHPHFRNEEMEEQG